jgi:hypothetical protein
MRRLAKVISVVLNPFLEIPMVMIGLLTLSWLQGYPWQFLALILTVTVVIPGSYFLISWYKRERTDWDIHTREMRLPLFVVVTVSQAIGVIAAYLTNRHPLAEILLGLWLVAALFAIITFYWKISVHTGVNATIVVLFSLFIEPWWGLLVIVGLVGWARVVDHDHTPWQVTVGGLLPVTLLPFVYRLWGVW